jgi:hypothetical protein
MCYPSTFGSLWLRFHQISRLQSNFIRIQHLEHFLILIQILHRILKNCNGESCSLFNSLQLCILFDFFIKIKSVFERIKSCLVWKFVLNQNRHHALGPAHGNGPAAAHLERTPPPIYPLPSRTLDDRRSPPPAARPCRRQTLPAPPPLAILLRVARPNPGLPPSFLRVAPSAPDPPIPPFPSVKSH